MAIGNLDKGAKTMPSLLYIHFSFVYFLHFVTFVFIFFINYYC